MTAIGIVVLQQRPRSLGGASRPLKDWWPDRSYQFPPDFVEYVQTNLIPLERPEG